MIYKKGLLCVAAIVLAFATANAQHVQISKEQLLALTPLWTG